MKEDRKGEKSHPTHTVILQKGFAASPLNTNRHPLKRHEGKNMERVILRNTSKLFAFV